MSDWRFCETPQVDVSWATTNPMLAGVFRGIEQARRGEGSEIDPSTLETDDDSEARDDSA